MKNLLSFILLLFGSLSAFAQNTANSDERQVQQLIQDSFDEILSRYKSERLGDFYTEDFLLLEQGEIWDLGVIRSYLAEAQKNPNPPTRTNRFEFIQTVVEGNRAWVAYHNYATVTKEGQVIRDIHWLESATAIKTEKGWRLDMMHSTTVEKE